MDDQFYLYQPYINDYAPRAEINGFSIPNNGFSIPKEFRDYCLQRQLAFEYGKPNRVWFYDKKVDITDFELWKFNLKIGQQIDLRILTLVKIHRFNVSILQIQSKKSKYYSRSGWDLALYK